MLYIFKYFLLFHRKKFQSLFFTKEMIRKELTLCNNLYLPGSYWSCENLNPVWKTFLVIKSVRSVRSSCVSWVEMLRSVYISQHSLISWLTVSHRKYSTYSTLIGVHTADCLVLTNQETAWQSWPIRIYLVFKKSSLFPFHTLCNCSIGKKMSCNIDSSKSFDVNFKILPS